LNERVPRAGIDEAQKVPPDTTVHDLAATQRHWQTLFALLKATMSVPL
jgi:hypothetical protein